MFKSFCIGDNNFDGDGITFTNNDGISIINGESLYLLVHIYQMISVQN